MGDPRECFGSSQLLVAHCVVRTVGWRVHPVHPSNMAALFSQGAGLSMVLRATRSGERRESFIRSVGASRCIDTPRVSPSPRQVDIDYSHRGSIGGGRRGSLVTECNSRG